MEKAEYIKKIMELMENCEDIILLDLIYKLLTRSTDRRRSKE